MKSQLHARRSVAHLRSRLLQESVSSPTDRHSAMCREREDAKGTRAMRLRNFGQPPRSNGQTNKHDLTEPLGTPDTGPGNLSRPLLFEGEIQSPSPAPCRCTLFKPRTDEYSPVSPLYAPRVHEPSFTPSGARKI
uniref:Uncharacterized protein n=1 Tax=Knipowitschia caucasica TaxID=637954 RepID=A0AAV2MAC7_KNICA